VSERNLWKGLLAGAIAGLVATAAKTAAEKLYPPRTHGEPEPTNLAAEKLAGHPMDEPSEELAAETIHWGFGIAAGAFYGAVAEYYPAATDKEGATFGMTLMGLTHNKALPALELSDPPEDQTAREQTSEAATHVLYGVVAEKVRHFVRGLMD
jgi:putative membrane protein